jgi:hypothetical protein
MKKGQRSAVWHLCRDQKSTGPISEVELYKLAELGHLRAGDLLWRPGFTRWQEANEIPGLLTPPPPPGTQSHSKKPEFKKSAGLKPVADLPPEFLPPAVVPKRADIAQSGLTFELPKSPSDTADGVPEFLVGLVSEPKAPTKPLWMENAKDRLEELQLGSKVESLVAAAALGAQHLKQHVKRPHLMMGAAGALALMGAVSLILARPGNEEFALRSSALTEANEEEGKIPDRFVDSKPSQLIASRPVVKEGIRTIKPEADRSGYAPPATGSIEMDTEFLRPKTVPRPGAVENAYAEAKAKPQKVDDVEPKLPKMPATDPSPEPESESNGSDGSSGPEREDTESATSAKPAPRKATSKAPGASKTVINVNTPKGIKLVQMRLNELGYLSSPPNGIWDPETTKALDAFVAKAKISDNKGWTSAVERALFATEAPSRSASSAQAGR